MNRTPQLLFVVGARPNFVKAAPVLAAARAGGDLDCLLVHSGQHYDAAMSQLFFEDLSMPDPDIYLEVGSGSHAEQTAAVMRRLEPVLEERRPHGVIVFGDVNSTLAAALTAAKLGLPVAHVEAGLRSFDDRMPEEINRRLTDSVSELLFATEASAIDNLRREGIAPERVHLVGNTMIDSLLGGLEEARRRRPAVCAKLGLADDAYAVLTLHRPSNVDDADVLRALWGAIRELANRLPVVFPVHPRTRARLAAGGLAESDLAALKLCEPLGYLDFLGLLDGARLVLTDSGGIQEETTVLGVPCLTLRENTERPVTLSHGTNRLVGCAAAAVSAAALEVLESAPSANATRPPLWDGYAAERLVEVLRKRFVR